MGHANAKKRPDGFATFDRELQVSFTGLADNEVG